MNLHRLNRHLIFSGESHIFTPADPFQIYKRLARIFIKAHHYSNDVIFEDQTSLPYQKLFDFDVNWNFDHTDRKSLPLRFLKWVYQEIPTQFWKFNVFIDVNRQRLREAAVASDPQIIWIDMHQIKNKTKAVTLTENVLRDLRSSVTYLPNYNHICRSVSSWRSDYKYNFGSVGEPLSTWKGGEQYV